MRVGARTRARARARVGLGVGVNRHELLCALSSNPQTRRGFTTKPSSVGHRSTVEAWSVGPPSLVNHHRSFDSSAGRTVRRKAWADNAENAGQSATPRAPVPDSHRSVRPNEVRTSRDQPDVRRGREPPPAPRAPSRRRSGCRPGQPTDKAGMAAARKMGFLKCRRAMHPKG